MVKVILNWYHKYFTDPDVIILILTLAIAVFVGMTLGNILAPVFASIVLAYLLQWLVRFLEKHNVPHRLAVILVFVGFVSLVILGTVGLLPALWRQLSNFFNELPLMIGRGQKLLMHLPEQYPGFITPEQLEHFLSEARVGLTRLGQIILSLSLASIPGIIMASVYFVLVPLLVFFFLMDREIILNWCAAYLPKDRRLLTQVWREVHEQIGNYIGGKVLEVIIVGAACYITFAIMGLHYAALLSALVGLSVIIPYIGAVVVTVPLVIIAGIQWGWSAYFAYFMLAYTIIQVIDANILVPLLFSEVVKLHPVAIILAVLFFGGIWGFWGVFFAIPLASLVKAVLMAWPRGQR